LSPCRAQQEKRICRRNSNHNCRVQFRQLLKLRQFFQLSQHRESMRCQLSYQTNHNYRHQFRQLLKLRQLYELSQRT
jgi:hypothetical protein